MTAAARVLICRAIESVEKVRGREDYFGSNGVLRALRQMLFEIDTGRVPERARRSGGMGHLVVDQWPLVDEVGSDVIAAEHAYLRLP